MLNYCKFSDSNCTVIVDQLPNKPKVKSFLKTSIYIKMLVRSKILSAMNTLSSGFSIIIDTLISLLTINKESSLISEEALDILNNEDYKKELDDAVDKLRDGSLRRLILKMVK